METCIADPSASSIVKLAPRRPVDSPTSLCLACGACSAGCPLTGKSGFDPRRIVRLVLEGRDQELIDSNLPWLCTLCGRCEYACPMGINIVGLVRTARGLTAREKVPGQIHKGVELALKTGNNLGLPQEDFTFIIEEVGEELASEPGFEDFILPVDKKGARILHTLHNKLVNTQNEDLVHWWKIFHMAKESWTIPSRNWEGCNWGYFSGSDDHMKTFVDRIVERMEALDLSCLMYPE